MTAASPRGKRKQHGTREQPEQGIPLAEPSAADQLEDDEEQDDGRDRSRDRDLQRSHLSSSGTT
jgi:hypothetical protein